MTVTDITVDNVIPRPVMLVAHARACSSAFERIFIQHKEAVKCLHEPFGDAYWMGPERELPRYEEVRLDSGFADVTFKSVMENIEYERKMAALEGKQVFIKDMAFFMFPAPGKPSGLARSFGQVPAEPGNPTRMPKRELAKMHFTFLLRHPRLQVPSYYRLSLPEHKEKSKVDEFKPRDAGYVELRQLFDYLLDEELIGPDVAEVTDRPQKPTTGHRDTPKICVIDAEDLIRHPKEVIMSYCQATGIPFDQRMLQWSGSHDQKRASKIINRWGFDPYFHKQALESKTLTADAQLERDPKDDYKAWVEEYGEEGAEIIQNTVNIHMEDYSYLKQFALRL